MRGSRGDGGPRSQCRRSFESGAGSREAGCFESGSGDVIDRTQTPSSRLQTSSPRSSGSGRSQRPLDLFHPERLDPVANLKVVEVLDANAALETFAHFPYVILEAL